MESSPKEVENVDLEGNDGNCGKMVKVSEGRGSILFSSSNEVFYNPVQELNRDLSVAVIKSYSDHLWRPSTGKKVRHRTVQSCNGGRGVEGEVSGGRCGVQEKHDTISQKLPEKKGLRILEALAASGLRSIRYALEIPGVESIVANDISEKAYRSIQRNVEHNGVHNVVFPSHRDASILMYEHREPFTKRFDVIDVDPYGSPCQFLDSTVQAVRDGGLLCVTCTDMSVLCGTHSASCHSKYGSMPLKAKYCHEMALRIVLASLESHANRYQRYIAPLLCCSIDFYVRLFLRIFTSGEEVKRTPSKLANVYHCIGCESFHLQAIGKRLEEGKSRKYPPGTGPPVDKQCDQCNSIFRLGGPIWAAPIHDLKFVEGVMKEVESCPANAYKSKDRIRGLLTVISEELPTVPLYYVLDSVCSTLHCDTPKMLALRSAIIAQGYEVSLSHANPNAVKTTAPHHVFWDIMRCWAQLCGKKQLSATSPAFVILSKPPKVQACFDIRQDANPPSRLLKLTRFPENPEANWGPKTRAKRKGSKEDLVSKRQKLQGKRTSTKTDIP